MRINPREKIMLMLLILVVVGYLVFSYVIVPQLNTLSDQRIDIKLKEQEVNRIEKLLTQEEIIDSQIEMAYKDIQAFAINYFNTTPQEEWILLLNDFLSMPLIEATSIGFSGHQEINVEGAPFVKDTITLELVGQYPSLVNLLKTIWAFPKRIDVTSIIASGSGYDEINASVTLDFYTLTADADLVDNLYEWYQDDLFYKENPFLPIEDQGMVLRYMYLPETDLFNYTKYFEFTDLEDHYMEREIYEFIDYGYLYMNPYLEFKPDEPITRGEFIVLLDHVYEWPTVYDDQIDLRDFRDYDDLGSLESSFAKAMYKGYLTGIIEGYDDNTLRPREPITYREVEFLMQRIKNNENFTWAEVANSINYRKGVRSDRWTDTNNTLTRAEAVYLLYYLK